MFCSAAEYFVRFHTVSVAVTVAPPVGDAGKVTVGPLQFIPVLLIYMNTWPPEGFFTTLPAEPT